MYAYQCILFHDEKVLLLEDTHRNASYTHTKQELALDKNFYVFVQLLITNHPGYESKEKGTVVIIWCM